jgi:Holliday junction DNA helicase RuvA
MITRVTGTLNRVLDEEVRLQVGGLEYQVLVPEFVRRNLQTRVGQEVSLITSHFLEGNPIQGKVVPRLIGFISEAEMDFFDLFCTVDKVGTRKALKALVRPIKEIANAISRQDSKWLTTLPGVGSATADAIVATLKRKVTRYALGNQPGEAPAGEGGGSANGEVEPAAIVSGGVVEDAYQALLALGHSPMEARHRLDRVLTGGRTFNSVEEILKEIYSKPQ